jgi:hypothetical protein
MSRASLTAVVLWFKNTVPEHNIFLNSNPLLKPMMMWLLLSLAACVHATPFLSVDVSEVVEHDQVCEQRDSASLLLSCCLSV